MSDYIKIFVEGWYVFVFQFLGSFIAAAIVIEKFVNLSRLQADPGKLMGKVKGALQQNDFRQAFGICQATPGPVSKVLGTTIRLSNLSTDEIKQGVEEAVLEEVPRLERFLPTLNTIITLEPLLGLLGTITGLMKLFKQYAVTATPEPALLAVGIQEALVTTAVGLAVAIVFYFFHNIIATRIDGVITQMEKSVVELLNFMRQEVRHGAEVQKTQPNIT